MTDLGIVWTGLVVGLCVGATLRTAWSALSPRRG